MLCINNSTATNWATLKFCPINLWSFPAAWKRDLTVAAQEPKLVHGEGEQHLVNPRIQAILAKR